MEDSSFSIQPKKQGKQAFHFQDIGDLLSCQKEGDQLRLECEGGYVTILFYSEQIVRIIMNPVQSPSLKSSIAVVKPPEQVDMSYEEHDSYLRVKSKSLIIKVQKAPVRVTVLDQYNRMIVSESDRGMGVTDQRKVICYKDMDKADHFYGFGEKPGFLEKRGEKLEMWNSDVFAPHNPETNMLYQSIPYFMSLREGNAYGIFFDNTFKTVFDLKTSNDFYSFGSEDGQLDYYIFAGSKPKDVVCQYTELTGKTPLPPKWALGYHQSRYSYETEEEVRQVVDQFEKKDIPLDAIYLDIHYMNGYRVFTFDQTRFPNPKQLITDLKEAGVQVVPIIDPGVKVDPEYSVYYEGVTRDLFCKYIEGSIFYGDVWPGKSAFPDFVNERVRNWWGENHRFLTELGIEGIWNDMNEPAVFNETKTMDIHVMHDLDGERKSHWEMHNVYGLYMSEATYEGLKQQLAGKRPFLVTRAGYAGVQRYAAVWTGDNRSFWEHLQMMIPMCMNLGLSGVSFCGADVGGFAHDTTGELLIRWMQAGAFTPFFRNHSVLGSVRQEPWSFGEEVEKHIKKAIELRYQLMPYLYTLFYETSVTGIPVMRPIILEYPSDPNVYHISDQFLVGEQLLVAPILTPHTFHRVVYFPEGTWIDYWTDETIEGGRHHMIEASMDQVPLFVKEGAILPHDLNQHMGGCEQRTLTYHIYPKEGTETSFGLYEDDGKTYAYQNGEYLMWKISCLKHQQRVIVTTEALHNQFQAPWKEVVCHVHGVSNQTSILLNGKEVEQLTYNPQTKLATFAWRN
ncbi:DUF4968 domain-containing protein [Desertibacillus haloalkaliphilus]|nr:DUF4968 domain-containing protein [Desertibacillus haloalkaliphilus]